MKRNICFYSIFIPLFVIIAACSATSPGSGSGGGNGEGNSSSSSVPTIVTTNTVTFYTNGAGYATNNVISPSTTCSLPLAPNIPKDTFNGWYTGVYGTGTPFTSDTTVAGNISVYAFTPNICTLNIFADADNDGTYTNYNSLADTFLILTNNVIFWTNGNAGSIINNGYETSNSSSIILSYGEVVTFIFDEISAVQGSTKINGVFWTNDVYHAGDISSTVQTEYVNSMTYTFTNTSITNVTNLLVEWY
jgi:hypothetical protein